MADRIKVKGKVGIYYRMVKRRDGNGSERFYYIRYKMPGAINVIEEPLGRASDGITVGLASIHRADRISGKELSNRERREKERLERLNGGITTVRTLWNVYDNDKADRYSRKFDQVTLMPKLDGILDIPFEELVTDDIIKLRRRLEKTPSKARWRKNDDEPPMLSKQTVKHVLELLNRVLRYAETKGLISIPKTLRIDMPVVHNEKTEIMTVEQRAKYLHILDAEIDQPARAYLKLLFYTGIRKTAGLCLKWEDIDFEHGEFTVKGGEGKKSEKTKIFPLPDIVIRELQELPRISEWVFPSPKDPGKHHTGFKTDATRAKLAAGLPKDFRSCHMLRHNFASTLAQSGKVSLLEISQMMGHEKASVTERYTHFMPDHLRKVSSIAEVALSEGFQPDKEE